MIFREPTHELLDSTFQLFGGHGAHGDAQFGIGPDPALTLEDVPGIPNDDDSDDEIWGDEYNHRDAPTSDFAFRSDAEFTAMFEQMRREFLQDPYHAGHCLFAHVALRTLAFLDPMRVLRLLRRQPLVVTQGTMLYGCHVAPHIVATTLFRSEEVSIEPLDLPGWTGALIVMPPPTQPSGVHFAAALVPVGVPDGAAKDRFEYITLEESLELNGEFTTSLGRRTSAQKYVELGPGPDVERGAFLEAVQAILTAPRESGTPNSPAPAAPNASTAVTSAPGSAPRPNPSPKPAVV